MKIENVLYTKQAMQSLRESLKLLQKQGASAELRKEIRRKIFEKSDQLKGNPKMGQKEEYLSHLKENHRRIVEGNHKIIYLIEGSNIIVTDIFDSRQDPSKIKS